MPSVPTAETATPPGRHLKSGHPARGDPGQAAGPAGTWPRRTPRRPRTGQYPTDDRNRWLQPSIMEVSSLGWIGSGLHSRPKPVVPRGPTSAAERWILVIATGVTKGGGVPVWTSRPHSQIYSPPPAPLSVGGTKGRVSRLGCHFRRPQVQPPHRGFGGVNSGNSSCLRDTSVVGLSHASEPDIDRDLDR